MRIRVGHSPDPDDAFMFWALTTNLVDRRGFDFEQVLADIQTLNQWARAGRLEVTALSLAAYPFVQDDYARLPHGASIGSGYGPVLVGRSHVPLDEIRLPRRLVGCHLRPLECVAVPGRPCRVGAGPFEPKYSLYQH